MVLSDKQIIEEMEKGRVVITPFNENNLSTSSYDVSLGEFYFKENKIIGTDIYNPHNKENVDRVWGNDPHTARLAEEVFADTAFEFEGISKDDRVILLEPGETILAHTNEFIGGQDSITAMMKARSSIGRNFLEVCKCAGWGDVGYVNRWTMEITNNSRYHHIPLVVGRRVAQIVFFETGGIRGDDYTKDGKYQTKQPFEEVQKNWNPHLMLPKMYNDREIREHR